MTELERIGCVARATPRMELAIDNICSKCVRGGDDAECTEWCIVNDLKKVFIATRANKMKMNRDMIYQLGTMAIHLGLGILIGYIMGCAA